MEPSSSAQGLKWFAWRRFVIIILSVLMTLGMPEVRASSQPLVHMSTPTRSQLQPQTPRWRQTLPPPPVKYDGRGAMLGGLIGGGFATTLGGMLGDEFTTVIGGFGGIMGGAVGSSLDTSGNGLSILGGAVGGSIGAGLGIRLKSYIFNGEGDSGSNKYSYKGLLDTASSTITKPLEGVKDTVGVVAAPLQNVGKPVLDAVSKPVAGVTDAVKGVIPPFPGPLSEVTKPVGEGVSGVTKPLGDGLSKVTNPLQNFLGKKKRALDVLPIIPVSAVTGVASAPVGLAVDAAGSVVGGSIVRALSKPLLAGAMSGIFGAVGGGLGAFIGGWGFNVIQNLII